MPRLVDPAMATTVPQPHDHCTKLDSEPVLFSPISLSSFSTFLLAALLFVVFFHFCPTSFSIFSFFFCTSVFSVFLLVFPFSPPPRPGITTRLSRGPWTCRSSGGNCKRRTQLTIPPQKRWYQTSASCSGTVRSSIMYVLPVFPLPYFLGTQGWMGISGLVLSCHEDLGTDFLGTP